MAKIVNVHESYTSENPFWVKDACANTPDWFYDDVDNITSLNGLLTFTELTKLVQCQLGFQAQLSFCYSVSMGVNVEITLHSPPRINIMEWAKLIPEGSRRIVTIKRGSDRAALMYFYKNGVKLSIIELSFIQRAKGLNCSSWKRSVYLGAYNQVLYSGSNGDFGYSCVYDPCGNPVFTSSSSDRYTAPQEGFVMRVFDSHGSWQEKTFTKDNWEFAAIGNCAPVRIDYTAT